MPKKRNTDTAALAKRVAALEQAVADLGELHTAELAELRARRERADPVMQRQQAEIAKRDKARSDALEVLRNALNKVRFALPSLEHGLRYGNMRESHGNSMREALPPAEEAVEAVRALRADPWPKDITGLADGDEILARGRAALAEFDRLLAEREAARRRRLPPTGTEGGE